jgi:hypothetical protein
LFSAKVQRVLSGEKVVVSNMVGGRFSIHQPEAQARWRQANETTSTGAETDVLSMAKRPAPITMESRKISLSVDEPLPTQLEGLLFNVQDVLRSVTKRIAQGRAPSPFDLTRLGEEVALLSDELALVDFVNILRSGNSRRVLQRVEQIKEESSDDLENQESVVQGVPQEE